MKWEQKSDQELLKYQQDLAIHPEVHQSKQIPKRTNLLLHIDLQSNNIKHKLVFRTVPIWKWRSWRYFLFSDFVNVDKLLYYFFKPIIPRNLSFTYTSSTPNNHFTKSKFFQTAVPRLLSITFWNNIQPSRWVRCVRHPFPVNLWADATLNENKFLIKNCASSFEPIKRLSFLEAHQSAGLNVADKLARSRVKTSWSKAVLAFRACVAKDKVSPNLRFQCPWTQMLQRVCHSSLNLLLLMRLRSNKWNLKFELLTSWSRQHIVVTTYCPQGKVAKEMCILFVYVNPDPKSGEYKIILASNRDEQYARPSKPVHRWVTHEGVYGGRS